MIGPVGHVGVKEGYVVVGLSGVGVATAGSGLEGEVELVEESVCWACGCCKGFGNGLEGDGVV